MPPPCVVVIGALAAVAMAEHGRALPRDPCAGDRRRTRHVLAREPQERSPTGSSRVASRASRRRRPAPGGAAVAQKVVLYEEDPADPNGKRFVGSAIWRTETVTPGPGQPPELAIRADVEMPERKLAMTWSLRRNTDKGLPASHTVEIMFKLPPDFPSGGISNVPGILMKQAEQTRGVPLAGLAVKVTNGFFLIGLSTVDADTRSQSAIAQGARLVRHSGRLQQQPPRHPRHRKGHARRPRFRRGLQGLEAVAGPLGVNRYPACADRPRLDAGRNCAHRNRHHE